MAKERNGTTKGADATIQNSGYGEGGASHESNILEGVASSQGIAEK